MYLMNLPYPSCHFCVPNTTQLSNTLAVYAKEKDEFEFTDRAIQVTGIMEFGDYTDEFGYEYSYRIVDATYEVLDTSNMSEEIRLWQQLASTDVISDVYTMFEYVNFLCFWPSYTAQFDGGADYLYPDDAIYFIETDGAQFNYGYKDGYFDGIIAKIKAIDENDFSSLVANIERAEALANKALKELDDKSYTSEYKYVEKFDTYDYIYTLTKGQELIEELDNIYQEFSNWLSSWEM